MLLSLPFWVVVISPSSVWMARCSSLLLAGAAVPPLLWVVLLPFPLLWDGGAFPLPASGWWRCLAFSPLGGGDVIPSSLWEVVLSLHIYTHSMTVFIISVFDLSQYT